ncbi:unnamed protein product [Effrenium voratum]|nr:unnamed protein product [Effrenium voratum]
MARLGVSGFLVELTGSSEAFALLNEVASAYLARKEVDSALKVAAAGLRLLRAAEDLPGELVALKATAQIHLCRGDTEPTLRLLQEVISLSKDSGDAADETDAHVAVARVRVLRSEAEEALAAARAALGAAKTPLSEAKARLGLARVLEAKAADPRAAEASKAEAAQAAQQAAKLFASARYSAGQLAALKVAWALGAASAKEAAEAFRGGGDLQSCGEALLEAADGAAKDVENAQKALEIFRELNHTKLEAKALHKLSAAERARGQQSASIKAAVDVVALFQRRGDVKGQAEATCELAKVYMALGMLKDALSEVGEARLLFQKLKQVQLQEARVLLDVAIPAHMALNEAPKAVAVAEDAANICRSLGDKVGEADAFKACAKVCVQQGDTKSALQASRQAAAVLSRARLVKEEAEAYHLTANVHIIRLEPREAVSSAAQALSLLRRPGDEGDRADALITASYGHSMALEADGALGSAEEAVGLARRTCSTSRLKKALHALAEAQLLKGQYGEAMDTAEEALQVQNGDALLEAHLAGVSCYGRLGWSQSKKKGLRANPKEMLQKAKAASTALLASGNRRFEADARFLMAKVQLQAGNVDVAINEVLKAYNDYGTLKDGQGAGWSGLLYAACLLRAPAKMAGGYSALTCQDVEVPQYEAALHTALVAHSTFRRIGDEEGTEAALRAVSEIRAKKEGPQEGSLPKDTPRPRPLPPAFSTPPSALVTPYHAPCSDSVLGLSWFERLQELVGGRQIPRTPRQALACFDSGEWEKGLAKGRAALELGDQELAEGALLHGGLCVALAATGRFAEALQWCCRHSEQIADGLLKEVLLGLWAAPDFRPGDRVQIGSLGVQRLGVLGGLAEHGLWHVAVTGAPSTAASPGEATVQAPVAPEPAEPAEPAGAAVVREADMTLLSQRLSEEQRQHWRSVREEFPALLGERMSSGNEARWRRLFRAAGQADVSGEEDGLPLEQTFIATLHDLCLKYFDVHGEQAELLVDVLGCRAALELEKPNQQLKALLQVLPKSCRRLHVRMCGPEVAVDAQESHELEGRVLVLELRRGLYHDVYPDAKADLVVAMNAGMGVPQYMSMWKPTLDMLSTGRGLLAVTSYTPGELVREEQLLRSLSSFCIFSQEWQSTGTLQSPRVARGVDGHEVQLRRGDVLEPVDGETVRVTCGDALLYAGPNLTPGRNRNTGRLVLQLGVQRRAEKNLAAEAE